MQCSCDMQSFWRSRLDRVVVMRHTAYVSRRGVALERELSRVGLAGFAGYRWTFPSPFLPVLARSVRLDRSNTCLGNVDVMVFGFYAEMKTAIALGARNVLILEDDVRFADDLGLIRSALDSLPGDFQEAHLSWLMVGPSFRAGSVLSRPRVGGSWVVAGDDVPVRDSSATIFSRAGMERFIDIAESALAPVGRGLVPCDVTDSRDMLRDGGRHTLLSVPLLARQALAGPRMSVRNFIPEYEPFCLGNDVTAFGGSTEV